MESKPKHLSPGVGPHTAHTLFKIGAGLLITLFYTIWSFYGLSTALKLSFAIYIVIPFIIHFSSWLQKSLIFMHNVWWSPSDPDYFSPAFHGMEGGRNFYIDRASGEEQRQGLGVWHILPGSLASSAAAVMDKTKAQHWRQALATSGKPIVMYFHGNMGSRATGHRVDVYKMIRDEKMLDCHVIAFDYSGFADSHPADVLPSESSVVQDALAVYKWICDSVIKTGSQQPKLYVWGHSLGTSISTHLLAKLQDPDSQLSKRLGPNALQPSGLVLEAPFTTMGETFQSFPLNIIYTFWPIFDWLFLLPLYSNDIAFETDCYLRDLNHIPTLIFHATADAVVPFDLGSKLYKRVKIAREAVSADVSTIATPAAPIHFHQLDDIPYELAHTFQYTHSKFPKAVREFFVNTRP